MSARRQPANTPPPDAAAGRCVADGPPPATVVDRFLETYVAWREHCADVGAAYTRWTDAGRADRAAAFASYRAALDREACAARTHELGVSGLTRAAHVAGGAR
jgi:hypothetical protein